MIKWIASKNCNWFLAGALLDAFFRNLADGRHVSAAVTGVLFFVNICFATMESGRD